MNERRKISCLKTILSEIYLSEIFWFYCIITYQLLFSFQDCILQSSRHVLSSGIRVCKMTVLKNSPRGCYPLAPCFYIKQARLLNESRAGRGLYQGKAVKGIWCLRTNKKGHVTVLLTEYSECRLTYVYA